MIYQDHQRSDDYVEKEITREELETHQTGRERVNDIENRLELSNMKSRHINDKIQMLELEKERIE